MDFKLNVNANKDVEVIMKAGLDFVRTTKTEGECIGLINTASSVESSNKFFGFGIELDGGKLYISGKLLSEKPDKAAPDPKANKPKHNGFKKFNGNNKKGGE